MSLYQVSISSNHNIQLKPCSCRGVAELWRSTRSTLIRVNFRQVLQLGCNPASTFCKTHSTKLQVSDHGLIVQMFGSRISTDVISTNSSHLDVAIDHEMLQPQRWCCDMSDTSGTSSHCNGSACHCIQLDFKARTVDSITKPFRFDFDTLSRSCCLDCCVEFSFGTRETDNRLCC